MSFSYYRSITVDHTKVAATLTNFPVLVSFTNSDFKSVGNGGNVQNSNGYDICFFSDSTLLTPLKWEMEFYNPVTGQVVAWVKIASLSNTVDTVIYVAYDDDTINSFQSVASDVWDSNFGGVWHMNNNAANKTVSDSTSNATNGTNFADTDTKDVTGKIDGSLTFNGTDDYTAIPNNATLNASTGLTISGWVKRLSSGVFTRIFTKNSTSANHFVYGMQYTSTNLFSFLVANSDTGVYFGNSISTITNTSDYFYLVASYTGATNVAILYINGFSNGSGQPGSAGFNSGSLYSGNLTSSTGNLELARLRYEGASYYGNVELDEIRVSNIVRSPSWITTEYNNQAFTSLFFSLGSQTPTSDERGWCEMDMRMHMAYFY